MCSCPFPSVRGNTLQQREYLDKDFLLHLDPSDSLDDLDWDLLDLCELDPDLPDLGDLIEADLCDSDLAEVFLRDSELGEFSPSNDDFFEYDLSDPDLAESDLSDCVLECDVDLHKHMSPITHKQKTC